MRITCLIKSLCLGGAERQLLLLASALAGEGHDVEIMTYRDEPVFLKGKLNGSPVSMYRIQASSDWGIISEMARHLKQSGCRILIAFMTGASTKACAAHILYPGFRLFVSERNMNKRLLPHDRFRFLLYRQAEKVICNNYSQQDFIKRKYPSLYPRTVTIPNFADLEEFSPAPHKAGVPRRIVVTARVCPRKNALGLIRAAKILSDKGEKFKIDWYGLSGEEDSYTLRCQDAIRENDLVGKFKFHRAVENVAGKYREADIFCLPSFYEGTSNSLAEALSCGLPVVCSAVSDNVRYALEGRNGFLFNPRKPKEIAGALSKAIHLQDDTLESFGAESRKVAQESFRKENFIRKYSDLITEE
ncbi:MAG: glycosyltransferase family 4 protein [Bacteroidales bacterium]|nr:glycosyltransferase family 4 protein [Bacteroidales bacterium]